MNDDTDKPLNPVGDAALEARITAWVLGEASPFEAAELEEICARDAGARLFEQRLRVLHGLIVADRKAGPDDEWKLPVEKRAKIEALFEELVASGEENREPEKVGIRHVQKPVPLRQTGRRALLALAACTVISAAGWMLFSSVGSSSKEALAMQSEAGFPAQRSLPEAREAALEELRKAVAVQEDAVEDKRKLLSQVIRTEGIVYWGDPSVSQGARGFTKADDAESAAKAYVDLEQNKIQLESQIESLLKYDGDQLRSYAAGIALPDNIVPGLEPQYQEARRGLENLKSQGVAENHPMFKSQKQVVEGMEKDLNESVVNLRETLKAKLALSNEQLARLQTRVNSKVDDAVKQGIANQNFVDAKIDFESNQRLLEQLKVKLASEETRAMISDDAMAMASADKVEFLPGGGGGGSGGGVGAPATPSAPAKPMGGPVPAPAAQPAPALAARKSKSELGQAVDESLVQLPERPEAKRREAGPPVKKPVTSYLHLSQNPPFTTKPALAMKQRHDMALPEAAASAPAEPAAGGAVASKELADRETLGRDIALQLESKPADGPEGFGRPSSEEPSRLQGGFGGMTIPGTDVTDIVTAGNRSGLGAVNRNNIDAILDNPAGLDSDIVAGGLKKDLSLGLNGAVTGSPIVIEGVGEVPVLDSERGNSVPSLKFQSGATGQATMLDLAEMPEEAEIVGKDAAGSGANGFIQDEGLKELADSKDISLADGGVSTFNFDGFTNHGSPITGKPAEGYSGVAQKEMIRRQNAVATSDKLRDEGRDAYAKGDYKAAVDKFKASMDVLPDAEMVQDRREYLSQVLADGSTALGEEYRRKGKYDEARQLAADALKVDGNNVQAKTLKSYLDDPIRSNPALAYDHTQNTEDVRRKLYIAEGNYHLGKFDDAHRTYEDVLRIDPYNKAARRGMAQVAQARADYYTAAYDQTKAQLLAEVDSAWELQVPPVEQEAQQLSASRNPSESIVIPEVNFEDASVEEALDFIRVRAAEMDPAKKGVPIVLAKPAEGSGEVDPGKLRIQKLQLKGAKLGDVMKEVARASGLEVAFEGEAVVVRPGLKTPTQADVIVDLMDETVASAEPFSTFSLHVSDASFKMAKAALDRGEVPAADGIRPEEFYNAFDYGDPAPANGEPVVCAVEQSAHPALPQRNLLRIGVKTGSQGRGGSTPLNLTLLLDSSGSMEREDRNAGLANAVKQLSGLLKEGDTVSVIGFARQPRLLVDRLPGNRAQELNAIFAQTPSEGGTNLEEGIKLGEQLAMRQFNPAAQNRIVLFTDGAANLGDAKPETLQAKIEQMRQNGIAFDAAGFGTDGLNDKLLERLTRNGNGRYYIVDRAEDADANFAKQLAGAFRPAAENVKVQVRFNPARVAKYKLIGFEEHRLKKEDFRNDAVDAAEMAAEEAGNALYQIETLPQGEGEVGEVSVRFRDAASGQMVERTWTIPYEAQAPAFDQAVPAIQLAGLAAFAAEKLRSAPLADAVDFQQLAPVMAKVKARYANSKPVAELEAMIGKLK